MNTITIEMPPVTKCSVGMCAYNKDSGCHARAITIGDTTRPGCDTFLSGVEHTHATKLCAGIGACKMIGCKFNDDLECMADGVQIGLMQNSANCLTYAR